MVEPTNNINFLSGYNRTKSKVKGNQVTFNYPNKSETPIKIKMEQDSESNNADQERNAITIIRIWSKRQL